jgi:predicted alpha/beta-fold hydrolase
LAFALVISFADCMAEDDPPAKEAAPAPATPAPPAEVTAPATPAPAVVPAIAAPQEIPFDYTIENGLYATITAMTCFKVPEIKEEKLYKLAVLGFKKDLEVRAMMHDQPAPLVVILLGLASKSKDPLARLWEKQLYDAGFNVMTFDSIFRPSFNRRSAHGVAGNLQMESYVCGNVLAAFREHEEIKGKCTKLYLLGASYGAVLSLNYDKLAKEGSIKWAPDRVLALSPPVSMKASAALLDKMYDEDRPKFGILALWHMKDHEPVGPGKPIPFSDSQMRAGIGYIFHRDLEDAVTCSKEIYRYDLSEAPTTEGGTDKNRYAFTRFIEGVVFPYWKEKSRVGSIDDLWGFGELDKLIAGCPNNVRVITTADDPLNDKVLLKYMQRDIPSSKLTVLPRGGHLGFLGTNWAKQTILGYFKQP